METPPPPARPPRPPLTYRKLFRWGLVFWVLLWLGSAFTLQTIFVSMNGGGDGAVEIGDGAVRVYTWGDDRISWPQSASWRHGDMWSQEWQALIREYPEILIAKLGMRGWYPDRISKTILFPFVGFVFLWLAAGFFGEVKLLWHRAPLPGGPSATRGSWKRVAAVAGAMLGLEAFVCFADHMANEADLALRCSAQIQSLRSSAYKTKEGELVSWVSDPGFPPLRKSCPAGGHYVLSPIRPPKGTPAAQCQREDHRRFHAGVYGSK